MIMSITGAFFLLISTLAFDTKFLLLLELHHFECRTFILQYHISSSTYISEKPMSSTTGNNNCHNDNQNHSGTYNLTCLVPILLSYSTTSPA